MNYRTSVATNKTLENLADKSGISASLVAKRLAVLSMYDMDCRYLSLISKMTESLIRSYGIVPSLKSSDFFEGCCKRIQDTIKMFESGGVKVHSEDQRCGLIFSIVRLACKEHGDDVKDFELQFMGVSEAQDRLIAIAKANEPASKLSFTVDLSE
jgi:hypothetical protein